MCGKWCRRGGEGGAAQVGRRDEGVSAAGGRACSTKGLAEDSMKGRLEPEGAHREEEEEEEDGCKALWRGEQKKEE